MGVRHIIKLAVKKQQDRVQGDDAQDDAPIDFPQC
jgi:hypothetical protein